MPRWITFSCQRNWHTLVMKAHGNTCDTRNYSDRYCSLFIRQNIDSLSAIEHFVSLCKFTVFLLKRSHLKVWQERNQPLGCALHHPALGRMVHPARASISDCFGSFQSIQPGFTMVVYEKIYSEAQIYDQYIGCFLVYQRMAPIYIQLFQQKVGLNHVHYRESLNIRDITE